MSLPGLSPGPLGNHHQILCDIFRVDIFHVLFFFQHEGFMLIYFVYSFT